MAKYNVAEAWKKREEEKKKAKVPSSNTNTNNTAYKKYDVTKAWEKRELEKTINFDTFSIDLENISKTVDSAYGGWQTPETMRNAQTSTKNMYNRIKAYQDYRQKYGSPDLPDLTELQSAYGNVLNDFGGLSETYGKYDSLDAYNNAVAESKRQTAEYEKMKTADLGVLQTEIDGLGGKLAIVEGYEKEIKEINKGLSNVRGDVRGNTAVQDALKRREELIAKRDAYLKEIGYGSVDELKNDVGGKKAYYNRTSWVQKGHVLESVGDPTSKNYDKDFESKSKYIAPKEKTGFRIEFGGDYNKEYNAEQKYQFINDEDFALSYAMGADDNASAALLGVGYEYMTDEEKATYNYYYNTYGYEKAEEYLNTIVESLGGRWADDRFDTFKNNPISEYLYGVNAGFDQFFSGLTNAFNYKDEYIPVNATQQLSGLIREDITRQHGWGGQVGYDLINTTSNMLPSILTSAVVSYVATPAVGANVGSVLMGLSAEGNAYQEMLNLGYDKGQARTYARLVGVSEAALERAIGGIGKLGGISGKLSKLVSGIDNGIARFAIRWGGSMASEGFEEAAQEVLTPIFMNLAAGYDTGAEVDWGEVVYSGLLGALSGGVLEGGDLAISSAREHSYNKTMGKNIKANERVADVFDIASDPEVASAYDTYTRYANKGITADNISDAKLGRLYSMTRAEAQAVLDSKTSTAEQREIAQKRLDDLDTYAQYNPSTRVGEKAIKKGYKDAESIVNLIESGLESAEGTDSYRIAKELKAKVENYDELAEIVNKKMNDEELTADESKILADSKLKISADEISNLIDANDRAIKEEENKDITTRLVEKGESEEIAHIVSRKLRGEEITEGEAQKLLESENALSFIAESVNEENVSADVIEKAKTMGKEEGALFIALYDGKTDVDAYANAFNLTVAKTKNNFSYSDILNHRNVLSNKQVSKIYSELRIKADHNQRVEFQKLAERTANLKMYKGVINDSVIDYENKSTEGKVNWKDLKPEQRKAITFMKGFAKATGLNLTLITDGEERGINGSYSVTGNTIELDIFAESFAFDAKKLVDTLIPTASHELTHWMEKKSPVLYRKISELVFSTLKKEDGLTESERIADEIVKILSKEYKKQYENEHSGETISLADARRLIPDDVRKEALSDSKRIDVARSEIIARACEDMLSRSKVGREIFNSLTHNEKKTLVEKVKDIIQNIADWVSEALGFYKAASYEASILRKYQEELEKLSALWDEMLTESVEVNQALEKSGKYDHVTSLGSHELSDLSDAVTTDGEQLFQYRAMVEDEDIYRAMLLKHKDTIGIANKDINDLFNMIDKAVDIISENLEALDYAWDVDINDRAFSPVKPNSDSLYKVSLDFSTLCRKRLLQQTIQQTLQNALNKNLSTEESIAIRDELLKVQEEGRKIEVACALCYVESARMKSPKQINKFLNTREAVIREFFANKSGGSIQEKIAKSEAKARKKLAKDNPDGYYGKNDVKLDVLTAPLSHMVKADADYIRAEKKKAKASYQLTEHEQTELDAALKMSVDDFTSAKGLENLAKSHPDIFDAYTSFVRNATHSKGIENDTWWRAGDSESIGDNLIAQMNAENGLRSQSWSDFQVIHLLDYIAATIELSTKGAKRQSYTKVPDYVKLLGNTGDMINMSLIPERVFNGKLEYDGVEGMAYEIAKQLREEYHETVGTICIGINNEQIKMLLEDATIDMVIPYHHSSMSKATRKLMHIPAWESYQNYQSEKNLSDADANAQAKKYGVKLNKDKNYQKSPKFSEWFNLEEARQIAKLENANPSNPESYKKYGKMYGGYMAMQNAANKYLKLCAERGISPKFSNEKSDFTQEANYWKLLIDRKMVDNVTGEIIEQKAIKPIFNEKSVLEILNDELARYPQVKADQEYAHRKVVEKFLSGDMKVDKSTLDAIKKPVDNVTEVNILESSRDGEKVITVNMSEYERYEVLKDKKIQPQTIEVDKDFDIDFDYLENEAKKIVETPLLKKLEELSVFTKYKTGVVSGIEFEFTRRGFRKSINSQEEEYGGNKADFAKVILNLQKLLDNSILIETHKDKARGTPKENLELKQVYVLISAFQENGVITPVQFEIKQYVNDDNRLYLAVALTKIETSVMGNAESEDNQIPTSLLPVSDISLAELFENVNPIDENFLKYIPNQFLNEEQIAAKNKALEKERKKYFGDTKHSDRDDIGYHAGDLGKSEWLEQQGAYRDTGHFGTGTYFVGNKELVANYNKRDGVPAPQHAVDFSNYNLYRVKNNKDGYDLHRQLQIIDGDIKEEWVEAAEKGETFLHHYTEMFDIAKEKFGDNSYTDEAQIYALKELAKKASIDISTEEEYSKENRIETDDEYFNSYYVDYLKTTVKENLESINDKYRKFSDAYFGFRLRFGLGNKVVYNAMNKVLEYQKANPVESRYGQKKDSLATVFMKALGYEGVDTRGTALDNTTYGSVIYDLKEDTVLYSDRDDTSIYDLMGETERIKKENEKLNVDASKLKGIIGTEEVANKRFLGLANYLKKISGSSMDSSILANTLKKAYSSMQSSSGLTWESIAAHTQSIAKSMLVKDLGVSTDYFFNVMNEIRKDKISLSDEQRAMVEKRFGGYSNFHRYVFGRANVTKDGKPLSDVWKNWAKIYPSLFDANVTEAEQIDTLVELVDALKSTSAIMSEYERQEAVRYLSTEIYNQFWNIAADSSALDEANTYRTEHKAMMNELRKDYEQRQKSLATHPTGETAVKYESLLKKVKETKKKEIALAKEHGREMLSSYKENAERKTSIQRITANALSLNEMLVKNSKDKHVPEIMRGPVTSLLQAIDFSSKRMLDKGVPTQKDISLSKSLSKVKDMMVKATNAHDELVELYGHGLDDDIEKMVDSVDNIMRTVGDNEFVLNKMTLADLQTLDKVVKTIKYAVNKLNKFHTVNHAKGIANLSQESVLYLDDLGKGKIYDGKRGAIQKALNWGNALPYYAFKRYGSGGMKVYEALQDGWDKFAFNTKAIIDYANETYTSKEVKEWSEEVKTFKIRIPASDFELSSEDYTPKYQEVQLTVSQIMSLYCLNKREQARGHLFQGGIRVADFKDKKGKIVSQSDGIIFTEKDISTILNSLTGRQKAVANELQRFMNTICTDWGNEVSMARFGYKAFGEENYFPIQSDKNNLAVNDETEQINSLFKLLNMSFTKSIIEKANNRIVISDIFDVFAQHTSDMAKYNALALPVLDAFKWYNYTEKESIADGTFKTSGVKQSIEKAFGKDGQSYFTTFLKDINGQQEVSRDTLGKGFFSNAKIAAVGANLRVVLLQPTSYARASAVIDNKYLTKALGHKPKIKKAETYCGIALWKSLGYYDTNIQRGVEEQIKHADTWKDKATEWAMKGAEMGDKITWGYLWNACELEIRDTRKDLKVGSKEFNDAVAKRLREVIYATQVVDSTMTRSQMMRSTDRVDKFLTAFASEPTLSYNLIQDAYMEYSLDSRRMGKKEALKKNGKRIARILFAYTMTNALAALVESGFDALRDDDDEEMDMLAFMKYYLSNFAYDMSITAKIPYVKELHSIIQGFGSSRTDTQWMEETTKAIKTWYKVATTDKGKPSTAIKYSIKAFSDFSGLPIYNVYRDTMATLNKFDLFSAEDLDEMFGE